MKLRYWCGFLLFFFLLLLFGSCQKEDAEPQPITLLAKTINGLQLVDGAGEVAPEASIELVFSAALDPAGFEDAVSITSGSSDVPFNVAFANQSSRAVITTSLETGTTYTLQIGAVPIAQSGARLEQALNITFYTSEAGSQLMACTTGNDNCLRSASLTAEGTADFSLYYSFPLFEVESALSNIHSAVIVVHGANRNANDYFNYLMSALKAQEKEQEVVLVAPHFQSDDMAQPGEFFWSGNSWREGQPANSMAKISSFEAVDQIISQLSDKEKYPSLDQVIVTGHSSGGLYTHLYAAANDSESTYPGLNFTYIVANSQYFYYPDGQRIEESNNQLYTPTGCTGYDIWPQGYSVIPPYLGNTSMPEFNEQFVNRNIIYLLGNGDGPDGALNTTDCAATLLGATRFSRGKNMYRYMELVYGSAHNHTEEIVEGVGHNGLGMYQSAEFRALLSDILD